MKVYDISQEVFSCVTYPGDPVPRRDVVCSMAEGAQYNLTAFSMCAHNGTHIDAPAHFVAEGKTVEQIPLERLVGEAQVVALEGIVTAARARAVLDRLMREGKDTRRLLIKGEAEISNEAARVLAEAGLWLLGVESQTVGPAEAPMQAHLALLGAEVVLLEGVRLSAVCEGTYLLCAAPLCLGGADGAPCRAVLTDTLAP